MINAESLEAVERERERERERESILLLNTKSVGSEICKFVNETILKQAIKNNCKTTLLVI